MQKPQKLRNFLVEAIPELAQNPEQLLIFVEGGNLCSTFAQGLSFEYKYNLSLVFTDYAGDLAAISIPLLEWLRINQSEILVNLQQMENAIKFNVEVVDNNKVDLVIEIPLTERVIVKRQDDRLDINYPDEPQYTKASTSQPVTLFDKNGTALASWNSVQSDDYYALDVVMPEHG